MSFQIFVRPQAARDLVDLTAYLEKVRPGTAEKLLDGFESTCQLLSTAPTYGSNCPVAHPAVAGLRICTIPRFRNHVILYLPRQNEIEILRVVHGARDLGLVVAEIE